MFEEFNLDKKDRYFILFILLFSTLLVIHYIYFNLNVGVTCNDVYVYLVNSLYFTGVNWGATETIYLSPTVCFFTSILFRMGLVDTVAIYIVTGVLAIFGNIGLYVLLRRYFDNIYSLTGVIIYSTLSLNLTWLANGTLDIPAVSFTIWLVLFSVIAIEKNPKYYIYASIIFVFGFYTRYTVVLTIPAILLYYVYIKGFKITKEDKKYIIKALTIGVIFGLVVLAAVTIMGNGQFPAGSQMINRASGESGYHSDPAYNPNLVYYIQKLPNFISNSNTTFGANPILSKPTILSWACIAILIGGALIWIRNGNDKIKLNKKHIIPISLFAIALAIFAFVSSLITISLVMVGIYILGKDSDYKIELMMLMWILSNLIFFSNYNIKVSRYIIPATPALIFFLIKGLEIIKNNFKINKNALPIILIILFAIQGFAFTLTFEPTEKYSVHEDIINYIIENNPDHEDIIIGTYNFRSFRWLYGPNAICLVSRNQTAIDQSNITYYISDKQLDELQNFTEIKTFDSLYLYERINT